MVVGILVIIYLKIDKQDNKLNILLRLIMLKFTFGIMPEYCDFRICALYFYHIILVVLFIIQM